MSIRIGARSNSNPPVNPAKLSATQLAETYKSGRRRDRTRIQMDVNRRDHEQQLHFMEKISCLTYLSNEEQEKCYEKIPNLYSMLFNTPHQYSGKLRKQLGENNFTKKMSELVKQEIVDEDRYHAITAHFLPRW